MNWGVNVKTPASVSCTASGTSGTPGYQIKATNDPGEVELTCTNFISIPLPNLSPLTEKGDTTVYSDGWVQLKFIKNKMIALFPENTFYSSEKSLTFSLSQKGTTMTRFEITRTFDKNIGPEIPTVVDEAQFQLKLAGYRTVFDDDTESLPSALDLLTFQITDNDGDVAHANLPEFTHFYDSIVWSADGFPDTYKVYSSESEHTQYASQWSSNFYKDGKITFRLRGYDGGKVIYETSTVVTLYERDFMGIDWTDDIVLQNVKSNRAYCLLDTTYEYVVRDITQMSDYPYTQIVPYNHTSLPEADFALTSKQAATTLMKNNVGEGQSATGKKELFKCLTGNNDEPVLYWENKTTRILMLHRPADAENGIAEVYYLHLEPLKYGQ